MSTARKNGSTSPGRVRQREATIRRATESAEALLTEGASFADLSVEQVISRAGIARSTFYSHFDDLGHLLRSLCEGVITEMITAARLWFEHDDGITRDELGAALAAVVKTYRGREKLFAAMAEASTTDPVVREEFHRMLTAGHTELTRHIKAGQAKGFVRSDVDPNPTAGWLTWMLERGLYQQVRLANPRQVNRHTRALTEIVWQTLYAV
ncbi:TetR/AcrR family transcriptional regulator [Gordonia sp. VNK21]|uniref:TetR/AcrR family transcriptional regulator n=1 Tax=Gordonia sp. VNK21 TaxID=3382483 RepID=UPI0038D4F51D